MEAAVDQGAQHIVKLSQSTKTRIIISISSIPGGGKTTVGLKLVERLSAMAISACCVSMDGFHYSRKELDAFEDPLEAHRRRGAAFTFNAPAFLDFVKSLSAQGKEALPYPSFSHELKDPSLPPYSSFVLPNQIVILEGNYLNLNQPIWKEAALLCTERWRIEVPRREARRRLIVRHLSTGVCSTLLEAQERVDGSDMLNGDWLLENSLKPDRIIQSVNE